MEGPNLHQHFSAKKKLSGGGGGWWINLPQGLALMFDFEGDPDPELDNYSMVRQKSCDCDHSVISVTLRYKEREHEPMISIYAAAVVLASCRLYILVTSTDIKL